MRGRRRRRQKMA